MRRLVVTLALLGSLFATASIAATARADVFASPSLASQLAPPSVPAAAAQQFDYAHDPAISGDGRFVAFDGSFRGVPGVWRRNLLSGEVTQVAGGSAELPSISADGRYVSFTTNEGAALTSDTNEQVDAEEPGPPNVYRRDMEVAPGAPSPAKPFMAVSAVSGSEEPLAYQTSNPTRFGSVAAGRSAMSADGQKVVFITTAVSNLADPATPPLQVAVRDLAAQTTQLVSAEAPHEAGGQPRPVSSEEENTVYGAVFAQAGPPVFAPPPSYGLGASLVGASISADGTTVAWMGQNIGKQAQLLADETTKPHYAEPLWRRITDLPASPTRRVTGGSDPASPACIASGERFLRAPESLADPCQGPFFVSSDGEHHDNQHGVWTGGPQADPIPQLSGDGNEVAFLASAELLALGEDFGKLDQEELNPDLYLADMREAVPRVRALRPLTQLASGNESQLATNAPIVDFAVAPDGSQVAFTTKRTELTLGSLALVSQPLAEAGLSELFDVDLADNTLTRVSGGLEGGGGEHPHRPVPPGTNPYAESDGVLSPSFSSDGNALAFASTASNLLYGDANTPGQGSSQAPGVDGSDVFVTSRVLFRSAPVAQAISPPPAEPSLEPAWAVGLTASPQRDGSVLLEVRVPGQGALGAAALSSVLIRRSTHLAGARRRTRASLATRSVASAHRNAPAVSGGVVQLRLKLLPAYRSLARRSTGLWATVRLTFTAAGHRSLHASLPVTFRKIVPRGKRAGAKSRSTGARR